MVDSFFEHLHRLSGNLDSVTFGRRDKSPHHVTQCVGLLDQIPQVLQAINVYLVQAC